MKRNFKIAVVAATVSFGVFGDALADEPGSNFSAGDAYYISVFGGTAFFNDIKQGYTGLIAAQNGSAIHDIDTGYHLGVAFGTYFLPNVRGEIEISHSVNSVNFQSFDNPAAAIWNGPATGSVKATNVLANVWYDIDPQAVIRPYVGGGIGASFVDAASLLVGQTAHEFNDSNIAFAFQVGAGVKIALSENMDFDMGYRFRGIPGVKLKTEIVGQSNGRAKIYGHFVQMGITVKLNGM